VMLMLRHCFWCRFLCCGWGLGCHWQVKRYEAEADKKLLDKPDLNKYVFCEVLQDCGQVRPCQDCS
jgi:hypothetical protein